MESGRLEAVPAGTRHLDTVRALHQTVVSLRTALEISKNELKELKEKYQQHSQCIEYTDVIEKLTIENHILRRKIIDSAYEGRDCNTPNIKLKVTYSPREHVSEYASSEVVIETATTDAEAIETLEPDPEQSEDHEFCATEKLNVIQEEKQSESPELNVTAEFSSPKDDSIHNTPEEPNSQIISFSNLEKSQETSFKTKLELLSKFDVRIKVRTLKEGTVISSTTSDSDSTSEEPKDKVERESTDSSTNFHFEEKKHHFENTENTKGTKVSLKTFSSENIKMAVPNEADVKSKGDKFDVQVRIISEENLVVKENVERSRRKDTLNLDVDDLSLRSMSEGDNSVFSEGAMTPVDPQAMHGSPGDKDQENTSGNESEEVDDIELIFTTDESKDMSNLQEDLVSIRETDHWGPPSASTHSTPVLIKFHTLDPDFQPCGETTDNAENENQENGSLQGGIAESSLKMKRVSLPNDKEIRHVAFNGRGGAELPGRGILKSFDNRSDNALHRTSGSARRLDSVDSLTCEYNRALSFDNTKSSSFELGSSVDALQREESVDSFHRTGRLGHRFSVFAETDISKCGISEDDLASNLNVRRNTCPNPFQYRPPPYRGGCRAAGPLRAPAGGGAARARAAGGGGGGWAGARRESAAQTDLSALPPRWSSDGYLAYKMCGASSSGAPTLPVRGGGAGAGAGAGGRRLTVPDARAPPPRPARRSDESRRVLLSDIGFTSMVPELSRSADPLWAQARRAPHPAPAAPPACAAPSKFLSRGSYRAPCASAAGADRGHEWTPLGGGHLPPAHEARGWRSSLPDVRRGATDDTDDTEELLQEAESYLRRSIDNLRSTSLDMVEQTVGVCPAAGAAGAGAGAPYIPAGPRHLRLGHAVKVLAPHGRVAVGRVRYVGLAGGGVHVGAEFPAARHPWLPRNDGTHRARRYFLTPPHYTALFVPFSKVVMAWAN